MDQRGKVRLGASQRIGEVFRIFDGIFTWKDWSDKDLKDNRDRLKKLGHQQGGRIGLVADFDEEDFGRKLQDGLDNPKHGQDVTFYMEPDNLMFRPHLNGGDEDQVWALRAIADFNNVHNERENRSTPLINQRYSQHQGFAHDLFWPKDTGDTSSQKETQYGADGESALIRIERGVASGSSPRYTWALNIFHYAGFLTDAEKIAQFKHAFKILEFTADVATGKQALADNEDGSGILSTVNRPSVSELYRGRVQNAEGEKYGETCIWSDIIFYQNEDRWGPLGIDAKDDRPPSGILCYGGLLWSTRKSDNESDQIFPDPENPDNAKRASEIHANKLPMPRKNRFWCIRPWIRAPRPTVQTGSSGGPSALPPGEPTPTGEDAPAVPTVAAGSPMTSDFKAGKTTAFRLRGSITETLAAHKIGWMIRYTISQAPAGGPDTIILFLGYRLYKNGESVSATPTFLKATISEASFPTAGQRGDFTFEIPVSAVEAGDTIEVSVWRGKGDTYAGRFKLLEHEGIIGKSAPSGEGGAVWP